MVSRQKLLSEIEVMRTCLGTLADQKPPKMVRSAEGFLVGREEDDWAMPGVAGVQVNCARYWNGVRTLGVVLLLRGLVNRSARRKG